MEKKRVTFADSPAPAVAPEAVPTQVFFPPWEWFLSIEKRINNIPGTQAIAEAVVEKVRENNGVKRARAEREKREKDLDGREQNLKELEDKVKRREQRVEKRIKRLDERQKELFEKEQKCEKLLFELGEREEELKQREEAFDARARENKKNDDPEEDQSTQLAPDDDDEEAFDARARENKKNDDPEEDQSTQFFRMKKIEFFNRNNKNHFV
jgi:hypothetical protein